MNRTSSFLRLVLVGFIMFAISRATVGGQFEQKRNMSRYRVQSSDRTVW